MNAASARPGLLQRVALAARAPIGRPQHVPTAAWIGVTALVLAVMVPAIASLAVVYRIPFLGAFLLCTLQCGSAVLALVLPRLAVVIQLASLAAIAVLSAPAATGIWPTPYPTLAALLLLFVVIGVREHWVFAVIVWWATVAVVAVTGAALPAAPRHNDGWGYNVLISVTASLLALGAAVALGQGRRIRHSLAEARRDIELEQARRRYTEERAEIARELHDVLAHSMSIVHIQATSAPYRLQSLDAATAEEFDSIARSARTALREMRQLLRALHPADGGVAHEPQAQIATLEALGIGAERVGTRVGFRVDEDARALSPLLQLTIYRVVQEAISNAVKHAPRSDVLVTVRAGTLDVVVEVVNAAPPRRGMLEIAAWERGGMGLRGMRERVELLGGELRHGPTAAGGFEVIAHMPVERTAERGVPA